MRTEIRFVLAIVLMIAVLVITNLLFPPVPPEELGGPAAPDSTLVTQTPEAGGAALLRRDTAGAPGELEIPQAAGRDTLVGLPTQPSPSTEPEQLVSVEGPLFDFSFSEVGARMLSARMLDFPSFTFSGPVQLIHPDEGGVFGNRLLVGPDTLNLRDIRFKVEPEGGLHLDAGGGPQTLRFTYRHPTQPFTYEIDYTFSPDHYVVDVSGRVTGVDAELLFTDLGTGIPFNEQRDRDEERASAYVLNDLQEGIRSESLNRVEGTRMENGPFLWVAFKSKYFVTALLAGMGEEQDEYLGGVIARQVPEQYQVALTASQSVKPDGTFGYRLFLGPQEFARLSDLGEDMQNVNPYGWGFIRPVVRPIVAVIMAILTFLHQNLKIGYGWVLILFGVMMRVVLFPLNQKAMRAQIKNMAVQPLIQEIQAKYKENPEKLQKEMMKLYKEHGFNPLAGCLPMLLPWPVLIALFFVFQNTIELRGVPFLWLPDLSAPDPLYILPAFLGVSMFLLQWVSMRSMPQQNQQMKMMMYVMPIMMMFIFFQLASGLNLYYATANIATLPQQIWIAGERKKAQAKAPLTLSK